MKSARSRGPGLETRRRVLCGLVALLAIWPAIHHGLTRSQEMDPWKLYGWAMYAAPPGRVQVSVAGEIDGEMRPLPLIGGARDARDRFAARRATLGRLASPEPLAQIAFDAYPELESLEVIVRRWTLERSSARLTAADRSYRFDRSRIRPAPPR